MDLTINLPRGSIIFYSSSRIFYARNVLEISYLGVITDFCPIEVVLPTRTAPLVRFLRI